MALNEAIDDDTIKGVEDLIPARSRDLIHFLDQMHPHQCIHPGETLEQAHRRAGCRELIDWLIQWYADTEEFERHAHIENQDRGGA